MKYYPIHLNIRNRHCLVVGGGSVAARKTETLLDCGAGVTVICPQASKKIQELAQSGSITLIKRGYRTTDLEGIFLVIGATDDQTLNQQISHDAEARDILCNIADRPEVCNFILPSIVRRGDLVITISTSGKSPALSKHLRKNLDDQFGEEYDHFLQVMGSIRKKLLRQSHEPEAHKQLFNQLIDNGLLDLIRDGKKTEINQLLRQTLGDGYVYEHLIDPS
jgi:precorrin-2 dehydrogenase/sirohydrochlorin ferrochelatase